MFPVVERDSKFSKGRNGALQPEHSQSNAHGDVKSLTWHLSWTPAALVRVPCRTPRWAVPSERTRCGAQLVKGHGPFADLVKYSSRGPQTSPSLPSPVRVAIGEEGEGGIHERMHKLVAVWLSVQLPLRVG